MVNFKMIRGCLYNGVPVGWEKQRPHYFNLISKKKYQNTSLQMYLCKRKKEIDEN